MDRNMALVLGPWYLKRLAHALINRRLLIQQQSGNLWNIDNKALQWTRRHICAPVAQWFLSFSYQSCHWHLFCSICVQSLCLRWISDLSRPNFYYLVQLGTCVWTELLASRLSAPRIPNLKWRLRTHKDLSHFSKTILSTSQYSLCEASVGHSGAVLNIFYPTQLPSCALRWDYKGYI